jgi:hypothetical protein
MNWLALSTFLFTYFNRQYPPHLLQDVACHLALSQPSNEKHMQSSFHSLLYAFFFIFARSPGHPVDEIHVHGGFLAEKGDLVGDACLSQ